jgi:hypothetical protein
MNDPAYRDEHAIQTATPITGKISAISDLTVVSTATLTRAEFDEMQRLRTFYLLGENFGLLRQIVRFVRHETGMREVDLYEALRLAATEEPWRWPALAWLTETAPVFMAVPVSWQLLMDEVRTYLVEQLGMPDDSALASALAAQHALLPAPGRTFPVTVELAHDVGAWHEQAMEAKASGEDWTEVVPRLGTFGPAPFTVDDPDHISDHATGYFLEASWLDMWELESPVARPHPPPAPV